MRKLLRAIFAILISPAASAAVPGLSLGPPLSSVSTLFIRVKLATVSKTADLHGWDFRLSTENGAMTWISPERTLQNVKLQIDSDTGGFKFKLARGKWQSLRVDQLKVLGQGLRLGLKPVPDRLILVRNQKGSMDVIGVLSMDAYLSGVVGAEMPPSWPMESLKAQSVAARSFAIFMVRHNKHKTYDVEASVFDQAFNFEPIPSQTEAALRVRRALSETARDVLYDGNRRIIKAYYSADCGCQSEDPKYVWGRSEFMESVKDPSCRLRSPFEWNWNIERSELRPKLLAALGLPPNSELKALHVASRTPSGRVHAIATLWSVNGENQNAEMNAQDFRRVVGFQKIRSTDFNLSWWGDTLQISGQGLGHGVGLCQRGARTLSEQGMNYKDILKFYYPKATIGTGPRT